MRSVLFWGVCAALLSKDALNELFLEVRAVNASMLCFIQFNGNMCNCLELLQNGDLFLQVRDILLHALASARKELESQLKSCGINLDDEHRETFVLKRAQFLLYTCRHARQPTQVSGCTMSCPACQPFNTVPSSHLFEYTAGTIAKLTAS